jgi:HSP20 family protein
MTLVRRNNNYQPAFPSVFDKFFTEDLMDWGKFNFSDTNTTVPAVNVKEDNDKYEIEVAAPGMSKKDFVIRLENDVLTISSEKKNETNDEKNEYSRREFCYQSFQRSFTLPEGHVHTDKIAAKYNDGILKIELPKRDEIKPQPPRQIEIK